MEESSSRPPATQSSLIILALGLLVGFVIAFVFVLSRLPVDSIISQYNSGEVQEAEISPMNFEYYSVLQETPQNTSVRPPADLVEPPASTAVTITEPPLPEIKMPEIVQPEAIEQPKAQAPIQPRAQPDIQADPQPRVRPSIQPSLPVGEMLANRSGQDSYFLETGSYPENVQALGARDSLRQQGMDAFVVVRQDSTGAFGHRVRIGPFISQAHLDDTRRRLRLAGISHKGIKVKGQ